MKWPIGRARWRKKEEPTTRPYDLKKQSELRRLYWDIYEVFERIYDGLDSKKKQHIIGSILELYHSVDPTTFIGRSSIKGWKKKNGAFKRLKLNRFAQHVTAEFVDNRQEIMCWVCGGPLPTDLKCMEIQFYRKNGIEQYRMHRKCSRQLLSELYFQH